MTIELLYWKGSPSEPAGHVGLYVNDSMYTFWPLVVRPDDTRGPVPSYINRDETLEFFTAGLRKLALNDLIGINKRLPSGIQIYKIIFEHFSDIKKSSDQELNEFFKMIDPDSLILAEQRQTVIDASIELSRWIKNHDCSAQFIVDAGKCDEFIELSFLSEDLIVRRIGELQALDDNLVWYAKVGAKTDTQLNAGTHMRVPSLFVSSMSGLRYYEPGKVRHNCASFILDIFEVGDQAGLFDYFNESLHITRELQSNIRLNAASKGEQPDPEDLSSASSIKHLNLPLRLMGYGKKPITDWFGTTPAVLKEIVEEAVERHEHPEVFSSRSCVIC